MIHAAVHDRRRCRVRHWSNTGQALVKHWSNTGQTLGKYWSNRLASTRQTVSPFDQYQVEGLHLSTVPAALAQVKPAKTGHALVRTVKTVTTGHAVTRSHKKSH